MRVFLGISAIATSLVFVLPASTQAAVQVAIDLTHQRMHVTSAQGSYDWPISSAASGFYTPGGTFGVQHMERMHYSRLYHMSPMPHSIFFAGGYAIHGTYSTGALGRPASHGCVRLSPGNAATLYSMVEREGASISISGSPPASPRLYEARRPRSYGRGYGGYDYASAGYGDQGYVRAPRQVSYGPSYAYPYSYGYGYGGGGYGYGTSPF